MTLNVPKTQHLLQECVKEAVRAQFRRAPLNEQTVKICEETATAASDVITSNLIHALNSPDYQIKTD